MLGTSSSSWTLLSNQSSDSDYHVFFSLRLILPPSSKNDVRRQYLFQSVLPTKSILIFRVNEGRRGRAKKWLRNTAPPFLNRRSKWHNSISARTESQKWHHRSSTPPANFHNKPKHCGYPEPRQIGNATVPTTMPWRHNDVHLCPRHTNLPVLPIVGLPVCPMTHTKHCWILRRQHSPKPR